MSNNKIKVIKSVAQIGRRICSKVRNYEESVRSNDDELFKGCIVRGELLAL